MKILLYLISFIIWHYKVYCDQPYFPRQIVFSLGNNTTILAIDEINQRAYQSIQYSFDPTHSQIFSPMTWHVLWVE
jgi:hypothetical protein